MSIDSYCFYVLTMRDAKRIASIENQMAELPVSFKYIEATVLDKECEIDITVDQNSVKQKYYREMSKGEIGCYLSHKAIWEEVVSLNKVSVIFEDDALIDKRIIDFLDELEITKVEYDVILMGHAKKDYRKKRLYHFLEPLKTSEEVGDYLIGRGFKTWTSGAVGYVITPEGARKLLNLSQSITNVLDDWPLYEQLGVTVKEVRPLLVWEDFVNIESSLEKDRQTPARKKIYFFARIFRGVWRNIVAKVRRK